MPAIPELEMVLQSGKLAYGDYSRKFERHLQTFIGSKIPCIAVNNSTLAIYIALKTLGLKSGDEVIASPMGCLVSTQPLVTYGLHIVWADIDPRTGTLDPDSVEKKITNKTKAIVHNHFCGYAGYIDEINYIAKTKGIFVIDDGIECFGTEYKKQKIGNNTADITIFNFGPVRLPNTIDGAAIFFSTKEFYERAFLLSDSGIRREIFRDTLGEINSSCDITIPAYSAKMSNVNAYIGIQQMDDIRTLLIKQRKNACAWKKQLDGQFSFLETSHSNPNYWIFGVLSSNKVKDMLEFREKGFYASGVHYDNSNYSVFGNSTKLLGVEKFMNSFFALPCGWWVEL